MRLWVFDLQYRELDDGTEVIIWCKGEDGSAQIIRDRSLQPFFLSTTGPVYIPTAERAIVEKRIGGDPRSMYRYSFTHPRDVRDYRHLVPPESLYEADIPFAPERYILSTRIQMSGWNRDPIPLAPEHDPVPPPLKIMSLDFEMYNPDKGGGWSQPDPSQDKILMGSIGMGTSIEDPAEVDTETDVEVYRIDECGGEPDMLNALMERIQSVDPDILCTYGGSFFDIPYAYHRAETLGASPGHEGLNDLMNWGRNGSR